MVYSLESVDFTFTPWPGFGTCLWEHTRGQPQYSAHTKNPLAARYPLLLGGERGTDQVNILPKDVIPHETVGITGDRTHDPWIMSPKRPTN